MLLLLADDDDASRRMLASGLAKRGHEVIEARNGAEAVELARLHQPDLMLMDISMPELDGLDAWRLICELFDEPPPVIAVTGYLVRDVELTVSDLGFGALLRKPIDLDALDAEIVRHAA